VLANDHPHPKPLSSASDGYEDRENGKRAKWVLAKQSKAASFANCEGAVRQRQPPGGAGCANLRNLFTAAPPPFCGAGFAPAFRANSRRAFNKGRKK